MPIIPIDYILDDYKNVVGDRFQTLSALKNDNLVITGGTGFVGTWLAGLVAYLNDTHSFNTQIILIAKNIEIFKKNKPHLANRKDVKLIAADVRYLHELPTETNWLIHAAGTPDNRIHSTYPLETMSVIAQGTQSVLRAVERCSNFKMLLNISSGLIYGHQPLDYLHVDENFVGAPKCGTVSSAYAEAKRYSETLCHSSRSQSRIPIVTARPFAFMGPYQSIETPWALNNFIKDALTGNAIRVLGDGQTVRSYMYASDMAFWLLTILLKGQSGEVYNVGSPDAITLEGLAQLIAKEMDVCPSINLNVSSSNQLYNTRFVPDVSLAQQNLQLPITVDIKKAIQRTIEWNKKMLS
jgi:nucleoside-diphosphate-sugar epimerase